MPDDKLRDKLSEIEENFEQLQNDVFSNDADRVKKDGGHVVVGPAEPLDEGLLTNGGSDSDDEMR